MWLEKIEILQNVTPVAVVVRLVLALILGGLLGIEREQKHRPAGLRTYVLVCLGATLTCITNIYMCKLYPGNDPARIPAQVISGIGFLGAGTIIVTRKSQIKGLTTAAGLWCCAAIGIAVGSGFYSGAILTTLIIVAALKILLFVDRHFEKNSHVLHFYLEYDSNMTVRNIIKYAKQNNYKLSEVETLNDRNSTISAMTFSLQLQDASKRAQVIKDIEDIEGCITLDLIL